MKTKQNLIPICRLCAAMLPAVMAGLAAHAATINWTNTSGGNWSVASNWSPNQVPTNADVVLITTPGTYTVTLDINTDFRSFYPTVTLGAGGGAAGVQTFAMTNFSFACTNMMVTNGGVLTANGYPVGYQGTLTVNGGVFNALSSGSANTLLVTNGGVINSTNSGFGGVVANGGIFNGKGSDRLALMVAHGGVLNAFAMQIPQGSSMTVASGGVLNALDSPVPTATAYSTLSGPLTNAGTINMTNSVFLIQNNAYFGAGGLVNQTGGLINFRGDGGIIASVGYPPSYFYGYIFNQGAITQTTGTNSLSAPVFDTTLGTITNLSGSLMLGTYETNLTGTYSAAAGATIQFTVDNVTPGTPFELNGSGQFQFTSGTLNLPAKTIPNLMLVGGYLELGPGFQGGAITNLALDGISLLSNSLPVTGTFAVTNSTLYGNYPVAGGGVFTGINAYSVGWVAVANGGVFTANGFVVAAPLTVAVGGVANLAGTISVRGPFTNAGTITISNAAISPSPGGIINQAGGLINFLGGGSSILYNTGSEFFHNSGAITQNVPGGTNRISIVGFDNAQGTVTNLAGTLQLGIFQTNLAGVFDAAPGAVIQFSGGVVPSQFVGINLWASPVVPGVPLVLAGAGQFQFSSGWLLLPANVIPGLSLVGGTLELGAGFQGGAITNLTLLGTALTNNVLPVTGVLTAFNSTISGNFTVGNGGVFKDSATTFGAVTVANGGLILPSGPMTVWTSGSLTLAPGGVMNIAGGGATLYGSLTNSGTINITNPPGFFLSGIYLYNDGTYYLGGLNNQPSGLINFGSDSTEIFPGGGGHEYLVNQGRITKSAGTNSSGINVPLATNSGAITAQSGLMVVGALTLLPSGSLNVGLNSTTNYGSFLFLTNIVIGGVFNATLNNGYMPANGTTFNVLLSYGGVLGTFSSLGLPSAVSWQSTYGSTNLTLMVGSAKPQFGTFNLSGTNLIFTGIGGSAGSNYVVLASTNLTLPLTNWTALTTNKFDATGQFHYTNDVSPAKSRQFFIFKLP